MHRSYNLMEIHSKYIRKRMLVRFKDKLISIPVTDIAYFYSVNKVSFLKTYDDQKYAIGDSLEVLLEFLDPSLFFKINRGFIISFRSIKDIYIYFGQRL